MPEVTGWYPGHIKPLADRPGWYERQLQSCVRYWWNGSGWYSEPHGWRSGLQRVPWRGLTAPAGGGEGKR